ncbi:MAG TPA: hypothetical protein GX505_05295 [Clostridiales bacterium]|nr:hypothetical protein [Clostridiales bacterium]
MKTSCRNLMPILKIVLSVLMFCIMLNQDVFASDITSYTYYRSGSDKNDYYPVPAPCPYNYVRSVYAKDLGVDSLFELTGIFVSDEYVYISSGGTIIITDHDFRTKHVITEISVNGEKQALTKINGLWATKEGELYACEPGKGRILHFNSDWTLKRILGKPEGILLSSDISYEPLKVAVDSVGRIYAAANNVYEGLIEINPDGTFSRYFGVVHVKFTAAQLFWRSLQTEIQRAKSATWLPVNFSNLTIDKDDFVYATVAGSGESEPIRKLNAKGTNILRYPVSTGIKPHGDLYVNKFGAVIKTGESTLTAIDVNKYGIYVVLDTKRNRIFAYDDDGYMLYAFGDAGITEGRFQTPVDIRFMDDDKLIIADRGNMSIEVYKLNDYGSSIHKAVMYQYDSDYRMAAEEWRKVLDYNPSFQYAYVGVGKALYRDGDYKSAQEYFKKGQDIDYYSEAFRKNRHEFFRDKFSIFFAAVVVILLIASSWKIYCKIKLYRSKGAAIK